MSGAPPDAKLADVWLVTEPFGGWGGVTAVRVGKEVVQDGGMADSKAPQVLRGTGVDHEGTSNSGDELVACLSYAVLLWGVWKGEARADAFLGVEGLKSAVEELTTPTAVSVAPITVNMADLATEPLLLLFRPGDEGWSSIRLFLEQHGGAVPGGMIDDGEKAGVVVPVLGLAREAEVKVNSVQGLT